MNSYYSLHKTIATTQGSQHTCMCACTHTKTPTVMESL